MNTYVIADTHGRFDLLCKAIDIIERDAGDAGGKLICLGDFVDRGPQARNIIDLLMAGPQKPNWEWVVLQGNHEQIMLAAIADQCNLRWWIGNGGGMTLASYGYKDGDTLLPLKVPQEHIDWLEALPVYHEDEHRIFVHAGVPFDQRVMETSRETMQWMLYPSDVEGDAEVYDDVPHITGKHIVHGHHQDATHPLLKPHRTNLDSFAWYTGRLAIGIFDDTKAGPVRILDAIGRPFSR